MKTKSERQHLITLGVQCSQAEAKAFAKKMGKSYGKICRVTVRTPEDKPSGLIGQQDVVLLSRIMNKR
jgi:hypothetical protein